MMIYGLACLLFGEARVEWFMVDVGDWLLAAWRRVRRAV